jgi:hypothetical protein
MAGPPKHGDISVSTLPKQHAKKHLAAMTTSMAEVKDYGGHGGGPETGIRLPGDAGQSSQGDFQQSGAAGAQYTTTNVGSDVGDADSGPSGY